MVVNRLSRGTTISARCVLLIVIVCLVQGPFGAIASGSEVESGRSLVIVFDTTWSMDDDLQALRAGAAHIVKEMLKKDTNPIHSYVFVPFNDPCEYRPLVAHQCQHCQPHRTRDNRVIYGAYPAPALLQYIQSSLIMESHYKFLPKLQQKN